MVVVGHTTGKDIPFWLIDSSYMILHTLTTFLEGKAIRKHNRREHSCTSNLTGIRAAYGNHLLWRIAPLCTLTPSTNRGGWNCHASKLKMELPPLEFCSVNIWPKLKTESSPNSWNLEVCLLPQQLYILGGCETSSLLWAWRRRVTKEQACREEHRQRWRAKLRGLRPGFWALSHSWSFAKSRILLAPGLCETATYLKYTGAQTSLLV